MTRVLIIEDAATDREIYQRVLSRSGVEYSFAEAELGEEGVAAYHSFRPDCILLDYRLPDIDGIEVLERLKPVVDDAGEQPAIIMLTGQGDETTAVQAMKLGAADYVLKSEVPEELPRAVSNALEKGELRRRLREKQEELEQFAHVAAHDLKAPLRGIQGYTAELRDVLGEGIAPEASRYLEKIGSNADGMMELIRDLLEYTRSGRSQRSLKAVELDDVIGRACANLETSIQDAHATVHRSSLPRVTGDATALLQLFQNLIANAIKFTDSSRPEVEVAAQPRDGGWEILVRDNGVGIPEEHRAQVFAPFYRAHARSRFPGTGIGLAHCKKIVEQHRGSIWVHSKEGEGTTFHFTLPPAL